VGKRAMAELPQDEAAGVKPNILGLAFPRRHAYQRMDSNEYGGEFDLSEFNSSQHQPAHSDSVAHQSPSSSMDAVRPISPAEVPSQPETNTSDRAASPGISIGHEYAVSPAFLTSVSPALPQTDGMADIPGTAPAKRKASKKSRFTEMLRRSLSSSWDSAGPGSSPGFEPARGAPAQDTSYPPGSAEISRSPHYLDPIAEHDQVPNRDDADNFSLKYSTDSS
jgi:hypothetical protein